MAPPQVGHGPTTGRTWHHHRSELDLGVDLELDLGVDLELDLGVDLELDLGVDLGMDLELDLGWRFGTMNISWSSPHACTTIMNIIKNKA